MCIYIYIHIDNLSLSLSLSMCVYIYIAYIYIVYVYAYIYICIYIERERERESELASDGDAATALPPSGPSFPRAQPRIPAKIRAPPVVLRTSVSICLTGTYVITRERCLQRAII